MRPPDVEVAILVPDTQWVVVYDTVEVRVDVPEALGKRYVSALKKYIGTKEATGRNDGEVVEFILRNCGFEMPQPWCGCFLNQGLVDIGETGPKSPGWSPSWFPKSKTVWVRDIDDVSQTFREGWVFGIHFRSLGRIAHVGAVVEDFGDGYFLTIEGNTNAQGGREGNGVFLRIRHKTEILKCAEWVR